MLARVELPDGRMLLAGRRGERWLYDADQRELEAAVPAGEDLVAIVGDRAKSPVFVGRSGTSYRAAAPLGAFVDVAAPFDPLARVAGAGQVLLGVGRDRRLSRSADQGHTWTVVGPAGVAFVDVSVDDHGNALALAAPEALWQSNDGGLSFRLVEGSARGILGLSRDPSGSVLRVTGVLETRRWLPGGSAAGRCAPARRSGSARRRRRRRSRGPRRLERRELRRGARGR
jgi:hypothetical protein